MAVEFPADSETATVLRSARVLGAETGGETGTDHLLTALLLHSARARRLLDRFDVTSTVAAHVFRQGAAARHARPDGVERSEIEVAADSPHGPAPFGPGAEAALARSLQGSGLLAALLHDDRSHAAALLGECGVAASEVREAISTGRDPRRTDPVKLELRECRDRLLGRRAFRGFKFRAFGIIPIKFVYAPAPFMWACWEADVTAGSRGRRTRTDDVLVAMLGTFEVASAYPHLIGPRPEIYDGTRELLAAGLDHERAAALAESADLGRDPVRPSRLLANPDREARDTTHLLRMLLHGDDNRASRLLRLIRS